MVYINIDINQENDEWVAPLFRNNYCFYNNNGLPQRLEALYTTCKITDQLTPTTWSMLLSIPPKLLEFAVLSLNAADREVMGEAVKQA